MSVGLGAAIFPALGSSIDEVRHLRRAPLFASSDADKVFANVYTLGSVGKVFATSARNRDFTGKPFVCVCVFEWLLWADPSSVCSIRQLIEAVAVLSGRTR